MTTIQRNPEFDIEYRLNLEDERIRLIYAGITSLYHGGIRSHRFIDLDSNAKQIKCYIFEDGGFIVKDENTILPNLQKPITMIAIDKLRYDEANIFRRLSNILNRRLRN